MIRTAKIALLGFFIALSSGCNDSGSSSSDGDTAAGDVTSTDYPYLLSVPKVTFIENVIDSTRYDVTVELEATGPNPIYSVDLWIQPVLADGEFAHLDLQSMGGNKWAATTDWGGLPAGEYYLDSIMVQDADPLDGGLVKWGWYNRTLPVSSSHYVIDQRLTNYDPNNLEILEHNIGVSGIPLVYFTLP